MADEPREVEPQEAPPADPTPEPEASASSEAAPSAKVEEAPEEGAQEGPAISPVKAAIQEAREKLARGESLIPEEEEDGAEEEPPEDPSPGPEEEGVPEEEEAPGEEEEEATGEEELELVTFEIPPRNADGEPVPVEVPADLIEHFNRLRNGYMRGEQAREERKVTEELREQVLEAKSEIDYIDRELSDDPVGFVSRHVKDTNIRRGLLLELLADDELWKDDGLQEQLQEWELNPEKRELFRTKVERDRLANDRKRDRERRELQEAREGVKATAREVLDIVPQDWEQDRQDRFYRRALRELGEKAGREGKTRFTREEIVQHLTNEGILEGFGISPEQARRAAPGSGAAADPEGGTTTSSGGARKAPPRRVRKVTPEEAQDTGRRFQEGSKRRRAAAAYAPAGAGAPAASVELPKGQGIKERIAYVRRMGLAQVLGQ